MKIKKGIIAGFMTLIGLSLASLSLTFSWFMNANDRLDIQETGGGVITQYFHCGTGTEGDPFVITRPVHLYNLTELYDKLPEFSTENYYFRLGYDLDNNGTLDFYSYDDDGKILEGISDSLNMNYYENFRPIGSKDKPFIGNFDGSHLTINKLNISGNGISDIGVFGYVTEEATVKDLYLDNLSIDTTGSVADQHDQHATNAYVGFIAGHIEDATCFTNTYVNNCDISGKSVLTKNDWGYFGKCDNAATLEQFIEKAKNGEGDNWGGSIDAKSYNDWIYGLYKSTITANNGTVYEYSTMQSGTDSSQVFNTRNYSDFTLHFATNYKTGVYGSGGNYTSYNYYMNPDCFNEPPDGKAVRNTASVYSTVYQFKDNNYIPLKFTDSTKTAVDSNNPGYIVGSAYGATNVITASPKLASYYYSSIGNSLQDTAWVVNSALANKTLGYTDSKLEVLTYKDGWCRIEDSHNSNNTTTNTKMTPYTKRPLADLEFSKYEEARNALQEVSESTDRMHGIHFENNELSASKKLTKTGGIKIHGETYNDLLKGSVEFHLKKAGRINFFAGTYYTATRNFNFFSIYKVERNNGSINNIKRISKIYNNTASGPRYVYKYSDNTYSTGTAGALVFDVENILEADAPVNNALYYFEVPVNEGEYAMGMVPGKSASSYTGAYMIYLDLSANAGSTTESVDDFGSIDYRTAPGTTEHNILLLMYQQSASQQINLMVVYTESTKRYDITYSGEPTLTVTLLNETDNYVVYVNGILKINNEIKSITV